MKKYKTEIVTMKNIKEIEIVPMKRKVNKVMVGFRKNPEF